MNSESLMKFNWMLIKFAVGILVLMVIAMIVFFAFAFTPSDYTSTYEVTYQNGKTEIVTVDGDWHVGRYGCMEPTLKFQHGPRRCGVQSMKLISTTK